MKLLEDVIFAARFSVNPKFSLVHCDGLGNYNLILKTINAQEIVERFKEESMKDETVGLEIRCNGMRVSFR